MRKVLRRGQQALEAERAAQPPCRSRVTATSAAGCRFPTAAAADFSGSSAPRSWPSTPGGRIQRHRRDGSRRIVGARHDVGRLPLAAAPAGSINVTEPRTRATSRRRAAGSRARRAGRRDRRGQIVSRPPDISAVHWTPPDLPEPMITRAPCPGARGRRRSPTPPESSLADARYSKNSDGSARRPRIQLLVAPDTRPPQRTTPAAAAAAPTSCAASWRPTGARSSTCRRQGIVEPVFGQVKSNRGADRFLRRGRSAVRSEWRLLTATHNLLKLYRHQLATG